MTSCDGNLSQYRKRKISANKKRGAKEIELSLVVKHEDCYWFFNMFDGAATTEEKESYRILGAEADKEYFEAGRWCIAYSIYPFQICSSSGFFLQNTIQHSTAFLMRAAKIQYVYTDEV